MQILFAALPDGLHSVLAEGEEGFAIVVNSRSTPEDQAASVREALDWLAKDDEPFFS